MKTICLDLKAQYQELDDLMAELDEKKWHFEILFFHWMIFDAIAHITFFDYHYFRFSMAQSSPYDFDI